ncbi:sodium:calcium antiporter [Phenylobacterium sp.]|uniref:sodium:calcium antiporter n=1 Tax=Phenylobacterium sp. TaxID=1871053 RepID=UPI0035AE608B
MATVLDLLLNGGDSLWSSAAIFLTAAVVVWRAGTRLAGYADRFARATGLSGALVGLLLLGGITSLPEISTSITAAVGGSGDLAANNLVGGVALQLVVLAVVDILVGRGALTAIVPRPDVLAYAAMNIALLVIIAMTIAAGEVELFGSGVGAGAVLILAVYGLCLWSAASLSRGAGWRPAESPHAAAPEDSPEPDDPGSMGRLSLLLGAAGAVILAGGYLLTRSGESLAGQTGLGANFFGAVFLGGATSLPELSSAIGAVRLKRPQMAMGDVLGGNLFNLALLGLVDVFYRDGPVLGTLGPFSVVAAGLGAVICSIYIVGLVERRDRTVLRMGYDSAMVLAVYAAGLVLLYNLRDAT